MTIAGGWQYHKVHGLLPDACSGRARLTALAEN